MTNMTVSANTLVIIASCLMMDSDFRHDFLSTDCATNRRICIHSYAKDKGWAAEAEKIIARESIRLLIEAEMGLDHSLSKSAAAYTLPQMMEAKKAYREGTTTSPSTAPSKDTTMNPITRTSAIEVTVQINVNGQNAANFSDAQLYGLIGQQEAEFLFEAQGARGIGGHQQDGAVGLPGEAGGDQCQAAADQLAQGYFLARFGGQGGEFHWHRSILLTLTLAVISADALGHAV